MHDLQEAVIVTALVAAALCFGMYFVVTVEWLKPAAKTKAVEGANKAFTAASDFTPATAADVAEILKGAASLVDSLAKVGPALWSLIGSILFLTIAAMAAGLLGGSSLSSTPGGQPTATSTSSPVSSAASTPRKSDPNENMPAIRPTRK